ncbi:MAG: nucleotide exchange factor GrpE, partial [Clostridia bacterium]|nr:nucleotide exchange factor GrpE [Clostridia bacterium]
MKKDQEVLEKEEIPAEETEACEEQQEESELDIQKKQYDELYDKHLRTLAEYENYKRRTQKEKDEIYLNAQIDTIENLLPVLDNLERAISSEESSPFKDGVEMIVKQLIET